MANRGCPDKDADRDNIADRIDACPNRHGLAQHKGCPPPDRDGDGVPDSKDRCKTRREVWNGVRDFDGCPDRPAARLRLSNGTVSFVPRITFVAGDRRLSRAGSFYMRLGASLLRRLTPGVVEVVVVPEYGLSYGHSLQRARKRATAVVRALTKLLPARVKVVPRAKAADGRRRVELRFR